MVVCFKKNEKNQGVMPKNHFLFACLSFMNIKEDFKNVGNNKQMKHKRKKNAYKVFESCLPTSILNV